MTWLRCPFCPTGRWTNQGISISKRNFSFRNIVLWAVEVFQPTFKLITKSHVRIGQDCNCQSSKFLKLGSSKFCHGRCSDLTDITYWKGCCRDKTTAWSVPRPPILPPTRKSAGLTPPPMLFLKSSIFIQILLISIYMGLRQHQRFRQSSHQF